MKKVMLVISCLILLASVGILGLSCGDDDGGTEGFAANFDATPDSGEPPLDVQFTDQSTGEIDEWAWDFDDGETSTMRNPTHTFAAVGDYDVSLTVTGPDGTNTETKTIKVSYETEVTWKVSIFTVEGEYLTSLFENFADLVKEKSEGRMEIKLYTGGTLYAMGQTYDAISAGSIDAGFGLVTDVFGKVPKTASLHAYANCMGISQEDVAKTVAVGEALNAEMDCVKEEAATNDVMPLMWLCVAPTDFFFTEPVTTLEDLQGMKLGGIGAVAPMIQAVGATPVVLDFADFYQSAQTGVIDGIAICPLDNYVNWKLYDVCPYAILSNLTTSACCIWMNQSSFEDLPADLQDALLEAAGEAQSQGIEDFLAYYSATLQEVEDNPDIDLYVLPGDEQQRWLASVKMVYEGILAQFLTPEEVIQAKDIIARVMEE